MRAGTKMAIVLLTALPLAGFAYEGFAVLRARDRTPHLLEKVRVREMPLAAIPARRIRMLLAVEDPGFFGHRGVDFSTPGQGMTTITQSLAKSLYFERFRPGFAKLELMLVARFALDPAMAKADQLEAFFNHARFGSVRGRQVVGFAAAARAYYGRELAALSDREYLSLVGMLIAPKSFDPLRRPAASAERTRRIEALLAGRCKPRGLRDVYYEDCAARDSSSLRRSGERPLPAMAGIIAAFRRGRGGRHGARRARAR